MILITSKSKVLCCALVQTEIMPAFDKQKMAGCEKGDFVEHHMALRETHAQFREQKSNVVIRC